MAIQWRCNHYFRSLAQDAFDTGLSPDGFGPLPDDAQPHATGFMVGIEPTSVIFHGQGDAIRSIDQGDVDLVRLAMAGNVGQRLLDHPVHGLLRFQGHAPGILDDQVDHDPIAVFPFEHVLTQGGKTAMGS